MLPPPSSLASRVRLQRSLLPRVITALGLALLLVVGAWSTSHGEADVHASLCLAPGVSTGDVAAGTTHHDEVTAVDVLTSDAAFCGFAVLWFLALVLLLARAFRRDRGILLPRLSPAIVGPRAGPRPLRSALTLTELSISRT